MLKNTNQNEINQLKETIKLKDKEIKDIKNSVADVLEEIRNINESNSYSEPEVIRRKISELCTDTRYQLLIDELDEQKIIELQTNCKISK